MEPELSVMSGRNRVCKKWSDAKLLMFAVGGVRCTNTFQYCVPNYQIILCIREIGLSSLTVLHWIFLWKSKLSAWRERIHGWQEQYQGHFDYFSVFKMIFLVDCFRILSEDEVKSSLIVTQLLNTVWQFGIVFGVPMTMEFVGIRRRVQQRIAMELPFR